MADIKKPLLTDETGQEILALLRQDSLVQNKIDEINSAADTAKQAIEVKASAQLQRIPDVEALSNDMAAMRGTLTNLSDAVSALSAGDPEKQIEAYYAMRRNGKIYGTKIYKFANNPTSTGTRLESSVGMTYTPSTDTTAGQDDFIDKAPMFEWVHVNYVRDADGAPRPVAIEGMDNYKTSGNVDVGAMQMSFYVKIVEDEDSVSYYVSDTQHEGFVPWCECVKADGTVLPWCIGSAYYSGKASDGLLRSQPGLPIELWQSHNNMATNYSKKGTGYWGAGMEKNTFAMLMQFIKTANKSSQATWAGCTSYNFQYTPAVESEEKHTYFPVTKAQAGTIVIGSYVSVGYGSVISDKLNNDRYYTPMHAYAKEVKVLKIEALDDANSAVYLDVAEGFSTAQVTLNDTISSPIYLSSMPWGAGSTDAVIGKYDGSYLSNTSGKTPYRIQGRECNVGCYDVASNTVIDAKADGYDVYIAPRGLVHSTSDAIIRSTYTLAGTIPVFSNTSAGYSYIGDVTVDPVLGSWIISSYGGNATQGMGDVGYALKNQTGTRECLQRGDLGCESAAGSSCLYCRYWLGGTHWLCGAGD